MQDDPEKPRLNDNQLPLRRALGIEGLVRIALAMVIVVVAGVAMVWLWNN